MHEVVEARLRDGGRTIMMLPLPARGVPGGARAAWVDVVQSYWDQLGPGDKDEASTIEERQADLERLHNAVRLHATTKQISRLDECLALLWLIPAGPHRKCVVARMLVHPASERHVHSWAKIATALRSNKSTVRHWHDRGIHEIVVALARK